MSAHNPRIFFSSSLLATLVAFATPGAAQEYVVYGAGCGAPLTISSDTQPVLGMHYNLQLAQAPPLVPTVLVLGFQQLALPLFGCFLLASPDVLLIEPVDASGHAEYEIPVPLVPALVGQSVYNQWATFNAASAFGLDFSQGGCSTIGNPQLLIHNVSSSGPASLGSVVTVIAEGLGTTNPDNLCIGGVFSNGERMLLRPASIAHDPLTGLDTVLAAVVTPPPLGVFPPEADIMIMRGEGKTLATPVAFGPWAWAGAGMAEAAGMGAQHVMTQSPTTQADWGFAYDGTTVPPCVAATIAPATYPSGSVFRVDVHFNVNAQPSHYDTFLPPIVTTASLDEVGVRDLIAAQLQSVFDSKFPGAVAIGTPSSSARIEVRMQGGSPSLQSGYGVGRVIWQ